MEWSSIKQNIAFQKWDPLLVELKHQQWGGEATGNDASQGSRATGESSARDPSIAMTGWDFLLRILQYSSAVFTFIYSFN